MCDQGVAVLNTNKNTNTHQNTKTHKDTYTNTQNINFVIRRVDE